MPLHDVYILIDSLEYSVHFVDAIAKNDVLGFRTLRNKFHVHFHLRTEVRFVQLDAQVFVGFHKGDPHWSRYEGLELFHCIIPLLDSLNVFVDSCISTDTVLVHLSDKVGFGK